ncbi:MAG: hypothetical protein ABR555_18910, partial [Pyrinomonadaceae bacterium]
PRESPKNGADWKMYHDFAAKNVQRPPAEYRTLARQVATRARNGPMIIHARFLHTGIAKDAILFGNLIIEKDQAFVVVQ